MNSLKVLLLISVACLYTACSSPGIFPTGSVDNFKQFPTGGLTSWNPGHHQSTRDRPRTPRYQAEERLYGQSSDYYHQPGPDYYHQPSPDYYHQPDSYYPYYPPNADYNSQAGPDYYQQRDPDYYPEEEPPEEEKKEDDDKPGNHTQKQDTNGTKVQVPDTAPTFPPPPSTVVQLPGNRGAPQPTPASRNVRD